MSAATLGQQGLAALEARDHDLAVSHLTKAIDASPSPKWLIARSKARVAAKDYPGALADAERAYHLALDRGSRDLIVDAQYRRAIVLMRQGKNADADACLAWVMAACDGGPLAAVEKKVMESALDAQGRYRVTELDVQEMLKRRREEEEAARVEAESQGGAAAGLAGLNSSPQSKQRSVAGVMRLTVLRTMKASPPDDPGRKLTVPLVPPKWEEPVKGSAAGTGGVAPAKAGAPPKKLRIDAYESDEYQTVSVFTKNVDKDKFKLEWHGKSEVLLGPIPEAPSGKVLLKLGGEADAGKTSFSVRPMKVELRIGKTNASKWNTPLIDFADAQAAGSTITTTTTTTTTTTATAAPTLEKPAAAAPPPNKTPAYPTSSKSGPKNWDAIADEGDDEDEAGADPNEWFKKLYAGGTEEQRRAMMKSFTESNGTTLSTDWSDVGGRTVETRPPDGVEAKKWD